MKITRRTIGVIAFVLMLASVTASARAQAFPVLDRTRSGTLGGDSAGAFDKFTLEHPGAGRSVTVRMTYRPVHPNAEKGIAFKVYGQGGKLVGEARKVPGTGGALELSLTANWPTRYLVQVQNYYPGFQMSYTLQPEGLVGDKPSEQPPAEVGTAQNPSPLMDLAQARLAGNRAGSFDFYNFHSEGKESVWIRMAYEPNNAVIAPGVGFNVYRGPDLVGQGKALTDDDSVRWLNLVPTEPSDYLIQVYNYIPGLHVTYQVEVTTQPAD